MTVSKVSAIRKRLLVLQSDCRLFLATFYDEQDNRLHCKECGLSFVTSPYVLGERFQVIGDLIAHQLRHYPTGE